MVDVVRVGGFLMCWISTWIRLVIFNLKQTKSPGFPRSIKSIIKVLNCEIGFQDLEKLFNLARNVRKILKKYGNSKINHLFVCSNLVPYCWWQFYRFFLHLQCLYVNNLRAGWFWGFSAKKTPKRTWLCAWISPLLFALATRRRSQKTHTV